MFPEPRRVIKWFTFELCLLQAERCLCVLLLRPSLPRSYMPGIGNPWRSLLPPLLPLHSRVSLTCLYPVPGLMGLGPGKRTQEEILDCAVGETLSSWLHGFAPPPPHVGSPSLPSRALLLRSSSFLTLLFLPGPDDGDGDILKCQVFWLSLVHLISPSLSRSAPWTAANRRTTAIFTAKQTGI